MDSIFSRPMAWPGCRFLNGRQICPIYTVALGGSREKISSRASQLKIPRHSPFSKQKVKPIAVDAIVTGPHGVVRVDVLSLAPRRPCAEQKIQAG